MSDIASIVQRQASPAARQRVLLDLVRTHIAAVTGRSGPHAVDPARAFRKLGVYRHVGEQLRERLAAATGLRIPATLLFDYPTPAAVADYLLAEIVGTDVEVASGDAVVGEPIAIIGMACRYPGGVQSPEDLWQLVSTGTDAVSGFPTNRGWDLAGLYDPDPDQPGKCCTREGGFLHDADQFDPALFDISPREAAAMDPQQRLLLETSWEAVERAGFDPTSLRGSSAGVFVGVPYRDYGPLLHDAPDGYHGYLLTGGLTSVASGRISYTLGLEGPAITVDTACSSSLVTLHLACQSLRLGECSLALTGGVTVMATPGVLLEFSRKRGLSPGGRCRSFSSDADGTGWGEGVGMLMLERLSDAQRNGHRVLAVVRGSALNQDGASNGLTAPNGPSQQRVIRAALASSGLSPVDIDAVEAHGTGTALGDPIEAQALMSTFGQDRDRPLWLGSLKSNIGHTQAAAGVGGVIKMVLAMQHGILPKTLHVAEPTPHIDWSSGAITLLTEQVPWPSTGAPRRAGVSSFGVSGTNAHVILEAPPDDARVARSRTVSRALRDHEIRGHGGAGLPWVVSGHTAAAVRAQVEQVRAMVDARSGLDSVDIGFSLATTRAALEHRAALVGETLVEGVADVEGKLAFVFPGQGSQWVGMARELLESSEVFAARMAECEVALGEFVDWPLTGVLRDSVGLDRVDVVQPVSFAVMVSLAGLWRSCGVEPQAVVGHSQGEIAAACVAGALSLADAARVVVLRSRAIGEVLAGRGGMVSVGLPAAEVARRWGSGVSLVDTQLATISIAAINSPSSVVVSGSPDALAAVIAECEAEGIRARRVPVDYASHSDHVEQIEQRLLEVLAPIQPQSSGIPFFSTLTGDWLDTADLNAGYWYRNLRGTVQFEQAVRGLADEGFQVFVECSAHPVLTMAVQETVEDAVAVGSLRRNEGGLERFMTSLAELYVRGVRPDWDAVFGPARVVDVPTYAFQRQRYWLDMPLPASGVPETGWRYRIEWRPVTVPTTQPTGTWLVVAPDGVDVPRIPGIETVTVELADRDVLAARLAEHRDVAGVLSFLAFDEEPHREYPVVPRGVAGTLTLIQALGDAGVEAPLWCVTRGAVSVGDQEQVERPVQAQVWGLGRVMALEHPTRWGGLIDLAGDVLPASVLAGDEDQVAIRESGVYARRLAHAPLGQPKRRWQPRGTVLVTGGTGALAGHVARWLHRNGAAHIVLVSRGSTTPDVVAELGANVTVASCDVADREALAALISRLEAEGHAPRAVVHTAGVADLAPLADTTVAEFAKVAAGKVAGAQNLDTLLDPYCLDAVVYFSSIAGVWGVADHGAYAAANAYLDAFAQHRRGHGLPVLSVAWGPWAGGGMIAEDLQDTLRRRGVPVIDPEPAIAGLQDALDRDETTVAVAKVDWERFVPVFSAARHSALIRDVPEVQRVLNDAAARGESAFVDRLAAMPAADQDRALLDLVLTHAASVLGHTAADSVDAKRAFKDLGFDSLSAVELRNRLTAAVGRKLPTTMVFDHPNALAMARYLRGELLGGELPVPVAPAMASDEPVAIVAMSCRYPGGVRSPEDLWQLLADGGDAITTFPTGRGWDVQGLYDPDPDRPGRSYTREGGFLTDAGEFDPEFFGISPREALAMDPQQRLLLETSWEAFERAGIDPTSLRGQQIGVFVGMADQAYGSRLQSASEVEGYLVTGGAASVASGRVAYTLGLEGPAVTVDTACSSSLVALHLAAQSVRRGECSLALAGGVMVMSTPSQFIGFSRQRGLAKDGRCKPFAEAADGFGLSEGAGLVLLERVSDAQRNGHEILAVVCGSAVNQDGASNGLTAPNGPSQQRVIRAALANARMSTFDIDAVEAHGTGTTLGDPIEANALMSTFGHRDRPLWVGSLKSNIGHTQTASGVAGVIKMVLAMRHGTLPKTLHIDQPSSHVDWSTGAVSLLTDAVDWPRNGHPRRAGISSFGISGTNAHVIIEQGPEVVQEAVRSSRVVPWVVSGRTPEALRVQVERLGSVDGDPMDIGFSLATTRAAFEHRAALVGETLVEGVADIDGKLAFVFPGQGSQWVGMARELLGSSEVFAARMAECEAALGRYVDWSLTGVLRDSAELDRVDVVQPVSFAVMVSLAALWRSYGIEPQAVVGHSQGEIAAACVAGALSLEDAARVVVLRSRAIGEVLAGRGGMVSVGLPADEVARRWGSGVSLVDTQLATIFIAAINSPSSVVISGSPEALDAVMAECEADGIRARRVPVDYASHSEQVAEIEDRLLEVLGPIQPRSSGIPFFSTLTGDWLDTADLNAGYWYRNLRGTVQFEQAVRGLADDGFQVFVECSAHPVLTMAVQETAEDAVAVGSLRRNEGGLERFMTSLAELYVRGVSPDWAAVFGPARRVDVPTYPFQRQNYWLTAATEAAADPVDVQFWETVEREDLGSLAGSLAVSVDSPLSEVLPALSAWRRRRRDQSTMDGWRYRVEWRPLAEPRDVLLSGTWLVVLPAGQSAPEVVAALADRGATVLPVEMDATLADKLRVVEPDGVLSLLALDENVVLAKVLAEVGAPLWCATRGAVAMGNGESLDRPEQALTWGWGTVFGLDHPDRWGGLVDLPETLDARAANTLCAVLAGLDDEDQVAIRPTGLYAKRIVRAPRGDAQATGWTPRGTVLITGGTGALGAHMAKWLACNGAEHLVLTSRRGPEAPGAAELADEIRQLGAEVTVAACDVADREALAGLLAEHELTAVVHAAGIVGTGRPVDQTDLGEFADVLAAKVTGARNLDELLADVPLDAFVMFSSGAGTWGNGGYSAYGAANSFLDALAWNRRARGQVATSIAWGAWGGGGMVDAFAEQLRQRGVFEMAPELAVAAVDQAVGAGETALIVADIDWARFAPAYAFARPRPLLRDLPEAQPDDDPAGGSDLNKRLLDVADTDQERILLDVVRTNAAAVLGHPGPGSVPAGKPFKDLGFDSLTAVDLRNRLRTATGLSLPATLVFDHPTPLALARRLRTDLVPVDGTPAFTELDRLEAALSSADREARGKVTARLRALLWKWEDEQPDTGDELDTASDDEMFDLIDRELGIDSPRS
ncbi:8,8a-deoxyoleandolide synthase/A-type KR domain-containing polyene macrolide polyketide synthase [Actinocrispum wychmicini]|uniref:6-deoxyerythronolide-B synthase n=1 Tax=Actinocrispum wychmicini TaxID=1213861 RepID=A0A4R2IJI4_9PSEU|nr:type I polyketide synthase [Actinocrispum wychmicini]TCO44757.1 8,8a-deoxyoleandolide synthase/A-type KR domain-containing polyene macrolide polyketide synthase [Actinocrispum wychmicini]